MLPACERFDAHDLAGAQVSYGLVVKAELIGGHGLGEVGFQRCAGSHLVVLLGIEGLVAVLAAAFGHVHSEVRGTQQFGGIGSFGSSERDADTDRYQQPMAVHRKRSPQRCQDSFGDLPGGRSIVLDHQDCELVATESGD